MLLNFDWNLQWKICFKGGEEHPTLFWALRFDQAHRTIGIIFTDPPEISDSTWRTTALKATSWFQNPSFDLELSVIDHRVDTGDSWDRACVVRGESYYGKKKSLLAGVLVLYCIYAYVISMGSISSLLFFLFLFPRSFSLSSFPSICYLFLLR